MATTRTLSDAEVEQMMAKIRETIVNAPRVQQEDMENFQKWISKEDEKLKENMNRFEQFSAKLDRDLFWLTIFSGASLLIAGLTIGIPLVRYLRQR